METEAFPARKLMEDLLAQAIERRPYITALALVSPGGRLWAAALPEDVEEESIAAMAAPAALLGRRIALEQLDADMRQVYVEGERGYAILRAIGEAAILLTVAAPGANLALVLHDVIQLEDHVATVMGAAAAEAEEWTEAVPAIERLRQLVGDGPMPWTSAGRRRSLQDKLNSLDLGWFPERVAVIRTKLDSPEPIDESQLLTEVEAELQALERDVMSRVDQQMTATTPPPEGGEAPIGQREHDGVAADARPALYPAPAAPADPETIDTRGSFIRRALRWLASMIASED